MEETTNTHKTANGVYGVLVNRAFFDDEWQFKQLNFTCKEWLDKDGKDDKFYTLKYVQYVERCRRMLLFTGIRRWWRHLS